MSSARRSSWVVSLALVGLAVLLYVALTQFLDKDAPDTGSPNAILVKTLLSGGGFVLVTILLLNELVVARVGRLRRELKKLNQTKDPAARLEVEGHDDVSALAVEVNALVDALAESQKHLRRAETALAEAGTAAGGFEAVFKSSPVPQAICARRDGRFLEANASLLALLGYRREELVGRTDSDLGVWADATEGQRWWQDVRERGAVRDVECRFRTKAGETCLVLVSAEPLSWQGEPGALLTAQDITERVSREAYLRDSQKMEAVTRLAAGFAHDFNNILCIVQGHASLMQTEPAVAQQCSASLKQIGTAVERAANLTRQLLTFSRKQAMKAKTLDLNLVLHGLSNMLMRILGDDIALKFNFSADVPLVQADTGMMEQLIMNLALNARDAMPRGGQLNVNTSAIVVDHHYARLKPEARVGQFACLTVSDTGCGLEPAAVQRIFEPFFTTKDVGKGTGLGLATVYGIVKQHQGWIEVASQPGHGTTFKIFLPASPAAAAAPASTPKPAPAAVSGGKERIFVVEDEPGLLALVQGILQRYGYDVIVAPNGVQALKVWEEQRGQVDLLVTDIVMPEGMTGRELADRLKAQRPNLKVIYTSGYSMDLIGGNVDDLVEGVNFLQKPYRPHLLAQTVRTCLDGPAPHPEKPLTAAA